MTEQAERRCEVVPGWIVPAGPARRFERITTHRKRFTISDSVWCARIQRLSSSFALWSLISRVSLALDGVRWRLPLKDHSLLSMACSALHVVSARARLRRQGLAAVSS